MNIRRGSGRGGRESMEGSGRDERGLAEKGVEEEMERIRKLKREMGSEGKLTPRKGNRSGGGRGRKGR